MYHSPTIHALFMVYSWCVVTELCRNTYHFVKIPLFSLHLARYRVPLACPFHVPCTSLATNCKKSRQFQVKSLNIPCGLRRPSVFHAMRSVDPPCSLRVCSVYVSSSYRLATLTLLSRFALPPARSAILMRAQHCTHSCVGSAPCAPADSQSTPGTC